MKKSILLLFLLLIPLVLGSSIPEISEKPSVTKQVSSLMIRNLYVPDNIISGNNTIIFFNILNGPETLTNVLISVNSNAPHMTNWEFTIPILLPNQQMNINAMLNYPHPGNYIGSISAGDYNTNFNANVLPNPIPTAPVLYPFPDISFISGNSYQLNLNNYVTDINGDTISWSYSNNGNVNVNINNGIATFSGNVPGTYFITLTASDGTFQVSDEIKVTVLQTGNLIINPSTSSIYVTQTIQLTASGGSSGTYTWQVISGQCSVSNNGLVTGNAVSTCLVRATDTVGGETGTATVNVLAIPNIVITPQNPTIYVSETVQLTASGGTSYTWQVLSGQCSVSNNGLVTGNNVGTCVVRADDTASPGFGTTNVNVIAIPEIVINPQNPTIYVSEQVQLTASGGTSYTWQILSGQCSVSNNGLVTGNNVGTCVVRADDTASPGFATTNVHVIAIPNIVVSPSSATVNVGGTQQFTASGGTSYTWQIVSGPCSINNNGLATGNSVGTCTIRADDTASPGFGTATLNVEQSYTITGFITDILTDNAVSGALIQINDNGIIRETTSSSNGFYSITVFNSGYLFTTIEKSGYVKRHTWATKDELNRDYTIIPYHYGLILLYNNSMRTSGGIAGSGFPFDLADTTRHWVSPPQVYLFSDNINVGGQNIDVQFNNLVYNAQNILPTFNPRDAIPSNVNIIPTLAGFTLNDNEKAAYFDDSIGGNGLVIRVWAGPRMNKCITKYRSYVGVSGPDVSTFNQELGSCFGSVIQPPPNSNYLTVMSSPPGSNTYTTDDYNTAKIYLDRNKIHYRNQSYSQTDVNGIDWEARPDIVEEWYSPTATVVNTHMEIIEYGFKGEVLKRTVYAYNEIPSSVMEKTPMLFTQEEINQRKLEEKKSLVKEIEIPKEKNSRIVFIDRKR